MLLNNKIVVAGAGGLLGSVIVSEILKQGDCVIAIDNDLERLESNLKNNGIDLKNRKLKVRCLDLLDEVAVCEFFNSYDGLTGAVNTIYPRNKTYGVDFFDVSLKSFNENLSMHLGGYFLFSRECAKYFYKHKNTFSLVNIASVYGVIAPKFDVYNGTNMTMPVEYAAIKSAILHLNKYISSYINNSDFRVNSISPGGIFDNQDESFLKAYNNKCLGTGMLDVKDVVGSIMFLLSNESKYITGQNLLVDDGFHL